MKQSKESQNVKKCKSFNSKKLSSFPHLASIAAPKLLGINEKKKTNNTIKHRSYKISFRTKLTMNIKSESFEEEKFILSYHFSKKYLLVPTVHLCVRH